MNNSSKAFAQPKLTKRQRKALRGTNSAVSHPLKNGSDIVVAGTRYRGCPPAFQLGESSGQYHKVGRGVPFVLAQQ